MGDETETVSRAGADLGRSARDLAIAKAVVEAVKENADRWHSWSGDECCESGFDWDRVDALDLSAVIAKAIGDDEVRRLRDEGEVLRKEIERRTGPMKRRTRCGSCGVPIIARLGGTCGACGERTCGCGVYAQCTACVPIASVGEK